jgi:hypothetical protein
VSTAHDFTLDDLQPWVLRAFEDAYQHRQRDKASREDWADAWINCLLFLRSTGSFKAREGEHAAGQH